MKMAAAEEQFQRSLRELVRCYQSFARYSEAHLRLLRLTPAQFDIIATLGDTAGMTPTELGQRTLITKGTLTGVLDRLESKGLLSRASVSTDRRSHRVVLTRKGVALFKRVFPLHLAHIRSALRHIKPAQHAKIQSELRHLREALESANHAVKDSEQKIDRRLKSLKGQNT